MLLENFVMTTLFINCQSKNIMLTDIHILIDIT